MSMRFLIPGTFSHGDSGLMFEIVRDLPWNYTPDGDFPDLADSPAFSLGAGIYQGPQSLRMSTAVSGASI